MRHILGGNQQKRAFNRYIEIRCDQCSVLFVFACAFDANAILRLLGHNSRC